MLFKADAFHPFEFYLIKTKNVECAGKNRIILETVRKHDRQDENSKKKRRQMSSNNYI